MDAMKTLGDLIRYYRMLKGWSQTQLWRAAGIRQSRMCKLENDKKEPSFWEMERIAFFLEVPLSRFERLARRGNPGADASGGGTGTLVPRAGD